MQSQNSHWFRFPGRPAQPCLAAVDEPKKEPKRGNDAMHRPRPRDTRPPTMCLRHRRLGVVTINARKYLTQRERLRVESQSLLVATAVQKGKPRRRKQECMTSSQLEVASAVQPWPKRWRSKGHEYSCWSGRCTLRIVCAANRCTRGESPKPRPWGFMTFSPPPADMNCHGGMFTSAPRRLRIATYWTRRHNAPPSFRSSTRACKRCYSRQPSTPGREVRRGAIVGNVKREGSPSVMVQQAGHIDEIAARLVVGADGRTSLTRKWASFTVQRDPDCRLISGVLFDDMPAPENTSYIVTNPSLGQAVPLFPQGGGRVRAYLIHQKHTSRRFQGKADLRHFVGEAIRTGAPAAFFNSARMFGPLATFEGADTWVEHPYRDGVALIGDAASSNDPSFGCGLSLTVRDARVLTDALLRYKDWDVASHAYAEQHDQYYGILHTVTQWVGQLIYDTGQEADARRARAMPLLAQDQMRMPDHIFSGPDRSVDESTRRRLFGEE
jgi:2-polyprenyl-6-methoxyphenol hydroxylase-like FAD-dependent oxidoreductase